MESPSNSGQKHATQFFSFFLFLTESSNLCCLNAFKREQFNIFISRNAVLNHKLHANKTTVMSTMLSIYVGDLTEEMPAIIKVCVTFTLLKSTISQDCTQTARQATYYAFSPERHNAFVEQSVDTVNPFSGSCNIFSTNLLNSSNNAQVFRSGVTVFSLRPEFNMS